MFRSSSPIAEVMIDIVRRGSIVTPFACGLAFLFGGKFAALSVLLGIAVILINFVVSAYILIWASKFSLNLLASMSVSGYVLRSASVAYFLWLAKDVEWVNLVLLGMTLVFTHLGLLFWELRFISTTMAHSGLKPKVASYEPAAGYERRSRPGARA